ncbi:putative peroxiredoxin [Sphingobium sp. SYK-6]|uniref:peroxiredoxin n=1 Tax=Sphingobium sp. (strain NBRC 103272 / SYK-6) TaxID=627192 RepID=UPI00022774C7|nr:peroxiredoxin [Sphingobium sp. SYK-6]BAK66063.1 putative peroxiredoxin [Sphingobium sp. SYK-6]
MSSSDAYAGEPVRALQIGDPAPNFRARTTMGDLNLSDYRGRWLLLFSHPADFTPVCTSEFIALSRASARFEALDCALLAISVDSVYAHLGWIRAIRDHFGVTVSFPIVEDPSLVIGRAYGMLAQDAPDAATLRSTFFIDPDGIIRAMLCYPATVGRSVEELLRVLAALQRVDSKNVVTPEGWRPGDDVLLPPHQDQRSALAEADEECWFHRTQPDAPGGRGA